MQDVAENIDIMNAKNIKMLIVSMLLINTLIISAKALGIRRAIVEQKYTMNVDSVKALEDEILSQIESLKVSSDEIKCNDDAKFALAIADNAFNELKSGNTKKARNFIAQARKIIDANL